MDNDTKQKETKLKQKENEAIKEKALYIETHSHIILEKFHLEGDNFTNMFLSFLLSEDEKSENINIPDEINFKDYVSSMRIIFYLCRFLTKMELTVEEQNGFRDKLRKYTRYFSPIDHKDLINANDLVSIDYAGYQKIKERKRTSSK